MPFTVEQFFEVFRQYNEAVWPAQVVAVIDAFIAVGAALHGGRHASRLAALVLAALWLWMGAVYHLQFFRAINPAAVIFAAAFIVQAGLLIWFGVIRARLQLAPRVDAAGVFGAMLVLYALVAYPLLGNALGHSYPAAPTFGLPCPTTIFTFGLFLWARPRIPLSLVVIPVLWALVGTVAALQLGVGEDAGLAASALVAVSLLARQGRALAPRTA
jgi:Family of unknown function (DUF6064)